MNASGTVFSLPLPHLSAPPSPITASLLITSVVLLLLVYLSVLGQVHCQQTGQRFACSSTGGAHRTKVCKEAKETDLGEREK